MIHLCCFVISFHTYITSAVLKLKIVLHLTQVYRDVRHVFLNDQCYFEDLKLVT